MERALRRRIALPDYFVEPVIVEQVVPDGELHVVTVRMRSGGLTVATPSLVRFGDPVEPGEVDLSADAFVLAPSLAAQLRGKPAPGPEPLPPPGPSGGDREPSPPPPPGPGQPARRYVLDLTLSKAQVFKAWSVIQNLSDRSKSMTVSIHLDAEAQDKFDPVWLRNAVEEPLDEAEITREGRLQS